MPILVLEEARMSRHLKIKKQSLEYLLNRQIYSPRLSLSSSSRQNHMCREIKTLKCLNRRNLPSYNPLISRCTSINPFTKLEMTLVLLKIFPTTRQVLVTTAPRPCHFTCNTPQTPQIPLDPSWIARRLSDSSLPRAKT